MKRVEDPKLVLACCSRARMLGFHSPRCRCSSGCPAPCFTGHRPRQPRSRCSRRWLSQPRDPATRPWRFGCTTGALARPQYSGRSRLRRDRLDECSIQAENGSSSSSPSSPRPPDQARPSLRWFSISALPFRGSSNAGCVRPNSALIDCFDDLSLNSMIVRRGFDLYAWFSRMVEQLQ